MANVVKEGRPSREWKRRGSSWEEGKLLTSDTIVRMGGGHLLCLIMKPHFFFFTRPVSLKKKCIVIYSSFPVFCTRIFSFFPSRYFSNVSSPDHLFIGFSLFILVFVILCSESEIMRKGPVVFFSFARLSSLCSFSLSIHLYYSISLLFLFSFFAMASRGGKRTWAWQWAGRSGSG